MRKKGQPRRLLDGEPESHLFRRQQGVKVQLWGVGNPPGANQQWLAQHLGSGYWRFIARHSGKCLDVPGSSTANAVQLQQYTCNGTNAQSFRLVQQ